MPKTPPFSAMLARSALACAAVLSGCSALSPQIFSERLLAEKGANGRYTSAEQEPPRTLEEAYADAAAVQRRYITAVQAQGNATPQLSAGLIGLSALTLFKGLTGPNTRDLAGAGVVGAASLAYGNTLISRPRLDVYRAGADALGCAMAAVEPMRPGQASLGAPSDAADKATLFGRRAAVVQAQERLQALLREHSELNIDSSAMAPETVRNCKPVTTAPPCVVPPGTPEDMAAVIRAQCRLKPAVTSTICKTEQKLGSREITPPANLRSAFNNAKAQLDGVARQLVSTQRVIDALVEAGPLLWKKSVDIQLAVSAEVDKTVPNLASVMAAAQGLRDGASSFSSIAAASPPPKAQGSNTARAATVADTQAAKDIRSATDTLRDARTALSTLSQAALGSGHAQARKTLGNCALKITGIQLIVTPSGDNIAVPLGGKVVFLVSGGSGVPLAAVVSGPKAGALPVTVQGGQFSFEFSPPAGVAVGDTLALRFTDGAGAAEKLVEVVITAAAPAGEKDKSPADAGKADTTTGSKAGVDATKFRDLGTIELALLGLGKTATPDDIQAAIDRCQSSAVPAIDKSGIFDSATRAALTKKLCKPQA